MGDVGRILVEDAGRGLAVDVGAAREGVLEVLVARHVGQDPQLDLGVVGGEEHPIGIAGDEGAPDPPAELGPDGDVLEIRVGRGQPAGRCDRLVERRVEAAVGGEQRRQRLDVGRPQLRVDAPLEQLVDHRMRGSQVLEHRGIGREAGLRPPPLGQVELEEEDLLELFGAAEVELVPDVDVDLGLETRDRGAELAVEHAERLAIERDADRLHPGEDGDQRELDLPEQPIEARLREPALERFADGQGGQRLETGSSRGRQLGRRRQDLVEVLGDHVRDRLASEGGVEDVRRDLGVEGDRVGRHRLVFCEGRDEDRLDLVTDEGRVQTFEQVAQCFGGGGAVGSDDSAVAPGDGEGDRVAPARPGVVEQQADADCRLGRQPPFDVGDPVGAADLDPAGIEDRRGQRGRQVRGRFEGRDGPAAVGRPIGVDLSWCAGDRTGRRPHGVEIEPELELVPGALATDIARGPPALGPAGDAGRGHVSALDDRPEPVGALLGSLALHRWQALDQRPEFVFAEETDDRVAVVVAQAGARQVELDRQVADDPRELATHADLVDVLAQLVGELGRGHLVEPAEQRLEVAELADELGGGLLADSGHTRDVVGGVALERLVVDHLVGPEAEPLVDSRDVVHDGVLDARPGRHQADARGHELEHVEVDGDDGRLEVVVAVELLRDRADDVVGLVALHLVDGDAEGLDDLANLRELVPEVVGHPHPGRLVLGVLLVTEGRSREVERDREVVRLEVLDATEDDAREPEDAVDEVAFGRRQGRQREVSAVDEPVAVEQHQAFHGRASARNIGSGRMPRVYPADPPART